MKGRIEEIVTVLSQISYPKVLIKIICQYDDYYFEGSITETINNFDPINYISKIDTGFIIMSNNCFKIWDNTIKEFIYKSNNFNDISCLTVMSKTNILCGFNNGTIKLFTKQEQIKRTTIEDKSYIHYKEINNIKICNFNITCIISSDTDIICGSNIGIIYIYNLTTKKITILTGHSDKITCLSLIPDGNLCSGSNDGKIRVWNYKDNICLKVLTFKYLYEKKITSILVLDNGGILAISKNLICIWLPYCNYMMSMFHMNFNIINMKKIDATYIIFLTDNNIIKIYNLIKFIENPENYIPEFEFHTPNSTTFEVLLNNSIVICNTQGLIQIVI